MVIPYGTFLVHLPREAGLLCRSTIRKVHSPGRFVCRPSPAAGAGIFNYIFFEETNEERMLSPAAGRKFRIGTGVCEPREGGFPKFPIYFFRERVPVYLFPQEHVKVRRKRRGCPGNYYTIILEYLF